MRNLPPWIRISDISVDNRTSFELSNGSQIKATSTSGDAGRSEALSLLVIDEAAHVEGLDELWTGLYPTLSTGGRCIALSTPNGVGNWFHKTYVESEQDGNDFKPINLPWDIHPERDQEWFDKETKNMSRRQIAQELECNFNTSGETVLHPDDLQRIGAAISEPKYRTGFDRNYWIWEEYQPDSTYLVSADVARGDGADYSVFHVIKLETMEQVAEYQGKLNLDMYANILNQVGREYGDALLVVENVGIGISVLEKLIDLEYPNVYHSVKGTHEFVEATMASSMNNTVAGFTTSSKTRPLIVAKLEEFIRNKLINLYSGRLYNEFKTFIWNNGKPQAMRSYHDDLVMSLAIACWVRDTALTANHRDVQYKQACLDAMVYSTARINTQIPGQQGYDKDYVQKMNQQMEQYQQYSWLLKG
tara:strand:- start:1259 stop:2512 length:1254 start_codon:yes stop_codon:yes gene_type:complete